MDKNYCLLQFDKYSIWVYNYLRDSNPSGNGLGGYKFPLLGHLGYGIHSHPIARPKIPSKGNLFNLMDRQSA